MTPRQSALYWRTWGNLVRKYGWSKKPQESDTTVWPPPRIPARIDAVATAANVLARPESPTPDHYRHALHLIALGEMRSTKNFTKPDFDRVIAYMQSLLDPFDQSARERAADPQIARRHGLVARCKASADEEYIDTVCRRKFSAVYSPPWWEDLPLAQLEQLTMTLARAKRRKEA